MVADNGDEALAHGLAECVAVSLAGFAGGEDEEMMGLHLLLDEREWRQPVALDAVAIRGLRYHLVDLRDIRLAVARTADDGEVDVVVTCAKRFEALDDHVDVLVAAHFC